MLTHVQMAGGHNCYTPTGPFEDPQDSTILPYKHRSCATNMFLKCRVHHHRCCTTVDSGALSVRAAVLVFHKHRECSDLSRAAAPTGAQRPQRPQHDPRHPPRKRPQALYLAPTNPQAPKYPQVSPISRHPGWEPQQAHQNPPRIHRESTVERTEGSWR